jgi:hypothetical protein
VPVGRICIDALKHKLGQQFSEVRIQATREAAAIDRDFLVLEPTLSESGVYPVSKGTVVVDAVVKLDVAVTTASGRPIGRATGVGNGRNETRGGIVPLVKSLVGLPIETGTALVAPKVHGSIYRSGYYEESFKRACEHAAESVGIALLNDTRTFELHRALQRSQDPAKVKLSTMLSDLMTARQSGVIAVRSILTSFQFPGEEETDLAATLTALLAEREGVDAVPREVVRQAEQALGLRSDQPLSPAVRTAFARLTSADAILSGRTTPVWPYVRVDVVLIDAETGIEVSSASTSLLGGE